MRRQGRRFVLVVAGVAAVGVAGVLVAQSALGSLGVNDATGKQIVDGWLDSGYINASPAAKAFKSAAATSRATLVTNAIAWARTYTESPAFKAAYERERVSNRPTPPDVKGSVDDELAKQSAERKKNVEEMKKSLAQFPPDMRKSMEAAIKEAEANNAKLDADPQMVAIFRQGIEAQRAGEQEAYKGRLAAYEKRWPADSKVLIARRLQEFLDISRDVDFDAKLVPSGRLMRFAVPRYEEKPPIWKLCYRAGREACGAARDAAQAWLKTM
jgi:hypothetical protein